MCIGRNQINTQITTVFRHIKLNMFWVCMHGKGNINVLKRISMPPWITITWQGNMLIFNFWLWHKFQSNTKKKVFSKIKCMEQSWQVITYQDFFKYHFLFGNPYELFRIIILQSKIKCTLSSWKNIDKFYENQQHRIRIKT